jgi:hypothetical protein
MFKFVIKKLWLKKQIQKNNSNFRTCRARIKNQDNNKSIADASQSARVKSKTKVKKRKPAKSPRGITVFCVFLFLFLFCTFRKHRKRSDGKSTNYFKKHRNSFCARGREREAFMQILRLYGYRKFCQDFINILSTFRFVLDRIAIIKILELIYGMLSLIKVI